jgi:hypothetical protein
MANRSISQGPKLAPIMPVTHDKDCRQRRVSLNDLDDFNGDRHRRRLDGDRGHEFRCKSEYPRYKTGSDHSAERSREQADTRRNEILEEGLTVFVERNGERDRGGTKQERHDVLCHLVVGEWNSGRQQNRDDDDDGAEQDGSRQRRGVPSARQQAQGICGRRSPRAQTRSQRLQKQRS